MMVCVREYNLSVVSMAALCLMTMTLLCGCKEKEPTTAHAPIPLTVTVVKPVVREVTNYIYFTGYTEGYESVEIRARVEGYLKGFYFRPGQFVRSGDLLFEIDPRELKAQLNEALANLARKKAELQLAEATYRRKESAYQERAVSELTVLEAKASLSQAEAEVKGAQASLDKANLDLSYTKIYSPVNGRISRNLVDAGNLVGAGGDKTLLATVINYDPMYVYFTMDERSLMLFKRHHADGKHDDGKREKEGALKDVDVFMALEGDKDYPYKGVGDYLENRVDKSTGTVQVRAFFENMDFFIMPGLFARIKVPYSIEKNALLIPDYALGADQRGKYLLIVDGENKVGYRPVKTGSLVKDNMRVIREGVYKDDRIIVKGIQKARPGTVVNPVTDGESKKSGNS